VGDSHSGEPFLNLNAISQADTASFCQFSTENYSAAFNQLL
jgi:hypothetical protein